jgi:hypothetical protein
MKLKESEKMAYIEHGELRALKMPESGITAIFVEGVNVPCDYIPK